MMSSYISTLSWTSSALNAIPKLQTESAKLTKELSTGRVSDVGLTLGVRTNSSLDLYAQKTNVKGLLDSNSLISGQMKLTQTILDSVRASADGLRNDVMAGGTTGSTVSDTLASEAQTSLTALTSYMNSTDGQRYVFGGINSGQAPMKSYYGTGSATAPEPGSPGDVVQSTYSAYFAAQVPPLDVTDPNDVAKISADQMNDFLQGPFAALFDDPAWGNTWSDASDQNISAKISPSESVVVSTNANEQGIRKLAMSYTMIGYLGIESLSQPARQALTNTATEYLNSGLNDVNVAQTALGTVQNRLTTTTTDMQATMDVIDARISSLEGVDTATVKTQLDTVNNQLDMSYSMTTKLLSLSIMNYV